MFIEHGDLSLQSIINCRKDNSFVINNVPSGSYVVEIVNPTYAYEPVRVEINSKGKLRARKVNYIQTSTVDPVVYPLALTPLARYRYFQVREQWRATDFLYSPMVSYVRCFFFYLVDVSLKIFSHNFTIASI